MMSERVKGKTLDEVQELVGTFKGMMLEEHALTEDEYDALGDLEALEGVKNYPVRVKCALLAWNTLLEAIAMGTKQPANGENHREP